MDQNELLAMLMQGGMPKQLMMNPAPALAGLPGAGQISSPMMPQQAPPNPLMAPPAPHPQMGMQQPMMAPPAPSQSAPSDGNPIARGLASFGSPLGQMLGKPGETPTASNTILQSLFGKGAQGGIGGAIGALGGGTDQPGNIMQMMHGNHRQEAQGTDPLSQIIQAYGFLRNLGGAAGSGF